MPSTFVVPQINVGSPIKADLITELKAQINAESTRRGWPAATHVIEQAATSGQKITSAVYTDIITAIDNYRATSLAGGVLANCACNCDHCVCNCNYCTCNCNHSVGCACNCYYEYR